MDQELAAPPTETMESLLAEEESLLAKLRTRKVVWVRVIAVQPDQVLVDIGQKQEGVVPREEFEGAEPPAAGQKVAVVLVQPGREGRGAVLSHRRAKSQLNWDVLVKAHAEKARVRGRVIKAVKGGFLVDLGGVQGFLPSSQADLRPVREPARMIGTGVRCYILEMDQAKRQVILSRRAVLEEEASKRKAKLLSELKIGEVRTGRVVGASPAGLIVDIGGAEGFVKAADLAWGRPRVPTGAERGARIRAKVVGLPAEGERIPLSVKLLTPNPSLAIKKKYPAKTVVRGRVEEVRPEGVKVALEKGDPAWVRTADLGEGVVVKPGDSVTGLVIGVDGETFDILVSLGRYQEIQDRKRLQQYLRPPAPLTLGELLSGGRTGEAAAEDEEGSKG